MKIWIDDVRTPPDNSYRWFKSVNKAKEQIEMFEAFKGLVNIQLIDIDHDAGEYASDGGDYIRLLDWLEETGRNYPIRIHSQNIVGVQNMRRIIQKNGWKEVF